MTFVSHNIAAKDIKQLVEIPIFDPLITLLSIQFDQRKPVITRQIHIKQFQVPMHEAPYPVDPHKK